MQGGDPHLCDLPEQETALQRKEGKDLHSDTQELFNPNIQRWSAVVLSSLANARVDSIRQFKMQLTKDTDAPNKSQSSV